MKHATRFRELSRETNRGHVGREDYCNWFAGRENALADEPTPEALTYLGDAAPGIQRYAALLTLHGDERGLLGPRELERLWDRHLMNCVALGSALPDEGVIVDIGSGAGLPGIVLAVQKPNAQLVLVESMDRRVRWLREVVEDLGLTNVIVEHGRAEDYDGVWEADVVTARAVAALEKLARWAFPLVRVGGELALLKGRSVHDEIASARKVLRKYGAAEPRVDDVQPVPGYSFATVLRVVRGK